MYPFIQTLHIVHNLPWTRFLLFSFEKIKLNAKTKATNTSTVMDHICIIKKIYILTFYHYLQTTVLLNLSFDDLNILNLWKSVFWDTIVIEICYSSPLKMPKNIHTILGTHENTFFPFWQTPNITATKWNVGKIITFNNEDEFYELICLSRLHCKVQTQYMLLLRVVCTIFIAALSGPSEIMLEFS